jgi:hypothetical protein
LSSFFTSGIVVGISLTFLILAFGLIVFIGLLKKYQDRLLKNFSQKIWMTGCLGLMFASLFLMGNFLLIYWVDPATFVQNFPTYIQHPWFLIRMGLAFFVLNAFLILALRALIIALSKIF